MADWIIGGLETYIKSCYQVYYIANEPSKRTKRYCEEYTDIDLSCLLVYSRRCTSVSRTNGPDMISLTALADNNDKLKL